MSYSLFNGFTEGIWQRDVLYSQNLVHAQKKYNIDIDVVSANNTLRESETFNPIQPDYVFCSFFQGTEDTISREHT